MGEATRHDGPVVAPAGDGDKVREAARARVAGRLPVLAGIAIAATLAIATSSAALLWMARHGGGTGGPASAASDTDNTPIPAPVATGAATVEACVPHGMAVTLTDGTRACSWDGTELDCSGGLDARLVGDDGRRATLEVGLDDATGSVIATVGRDGRAGEGSDGGDGRAEGLPVSMSATMATADGGTLSVSGDAWGMAGGGTVAVAPAAMRFGAAQDGAGGGGDDATGKADDETGGKATGEEDTGEADGRGSGKVDGRVDKQADGKASGKGDGKRDETAGEKADGKGGEKGSGESPADGRTARPLTLGARVTYVVGADDAAHCGSVVFCTATLSAGAGTTEAYLVPTTRSASADSPHGLAAGTELSVGRRTDRPGREGVSECSRVAVAPGTKVCESGYAG